MDFNSTTPYDTLVEKWNPVLEHKDLEEINDIHKKRVTAVLLENQKNAMREQLLTEAPVNAMGGGFSAVQGSASSGSLAGYDPILISLVRRAMPNVVAYDICGVQPMTAPTGLIFAMRSKYDSQNGFESHFDEPYPKFSGASGSTAGITFGFSPLEGGTFLRSGGADGEQGTATGQWPTRNANNDPLSTFRGFSTATAEGLGESGGTQFQQMAFSIERVAVEAKTRALKAEYTTELAQDLKAVHGLDAEAELANILSTEILNEINREIIRTMYFVAKTGCKQPDLANYSSGTGGIYDILNDSDGRWSAERFRGLMFQIEREANVIAKETRRGKGNFIICSSDVASALAMGGFLNLAPAMTANLNVDDTGNVFAGVLNGKIKVYIDPFVNTNQNFVCVGYKGATPYDAGFFYCPYVPLQMVRAVNQDTFQPKIGFKTRYGMVANPFAKGRASFAGSSAAQSGLDKDTNVYYRLFRVDNLHGQTGGYFA
jgi:hypothetical protein